MTGCEVIPFTADAIALSFLPLSHVFERMLDYAYLYKTASIAYAESIDKLAANFLEVNPHCFGAVPRVYEKVHARILAKADAGSPLKKKIFAWAVGVGRERVAVHRARGSRCRRASRARRRSPTRSSSRRSAPPSGASFRFAVSGGAPLSRDLAEFFVGAGVHDLRGLRPDGDLAGHLRQRAGALAPGHGRAGRSAASRSRSRADGEILTRGPHIMKGYFNKPEATAEAIDARRAGSTPATSASSTDGFLAITDRKKDLIVLAGGKKAAPQPIENELKKSPYIGLPIVIGDRQKFLAALIVPNFDRLQGVGGGGRSRDVRWEAHRRGPRRCARLFQREIDAYNADKPHHEQIRAFAAAAVGPDDRGRLDHADAQGQAPHPRDPLPRADRGRCTQAAGKSHVA